MPHAPELDRWTVVVPLKGGPAAKSRLAGPAGLATAIALDSLDAARAARSVGTVVVASRDDALAAGARALGARVVAEPAGSGLHGAVEAGLGAAGDETGATGVAVLLGDVPALRPEDLDDALAACARALAGAPAAFVPDADGAGTVLLAARRPVGLVHRFGPGSAARHAAAGAVRLDVALPRLRRDVDTAADLAEAVALGLGPRTAALLAPLPRHDHGLG